jgi:peptidylprolyl isomerase
MILKKQDFIEVEYTAIDKNSGNIVDTTSEKEAEEARIKQENVKYGSLIVCLGHKDVIKGVDEFLIGKELGKFEVELKPEDAFGAKRGDLIQLVPTSTFSQNDIKPFPGLQLNLDGMLCTIRSVSGGRVMVDFNHPLAGKTINYNIEVKRKVEDLNEKVKSVLSMRLEKFEIKNLADGKLEIKAELKKELQDLLEKEIKEKILEIKEIKINNA